ncbi:hypothetical protein F3Y22_tig00112429pilonHSYRG00011 [Hibiscus syriacus]|uniref:Uncharacterized protein n=1 Tax=Hibiscus syriacus TaxID=106335 RepID=A0A6A2XCI9_HIBSY|nr:hypothetical protein F3Y22_tig00112429pilonHSYRG00011 [Hibiscus syriacus]
MCLRTTSRPSKALEGVHGVQVSPHSPFAFVEINQHGEFQSTHDGSFITANQPLLMQQVKAKLMLRTICSNPIWDRNLQETVANVLTSLPFMALGIQGPMKNLNTRLYANSLTGVGVASSLYHSSRGKLRKYLRWADYTMITTATVVMSIKSSQEREPEVTNGSFGFILPVQPLMVSAVHTGMMEVAFAKRALEDSEIRVAHNVLGVVLFIADDVFRRTPFIHAAWHLAAAVGVCTCNKLLE